LRPVFADLIKNHKFSDCRILVENESFDCHKVILASSSRFFERLFLSSFDDSKQNEIRLQEVKPATFAVFIQYVYTYSYEVLRKCSDSMIIDLITCGNKFLVISIVADCRYILQERAETIEICDLFSLFRTAVSIDDDILKALSSTGLKRNLGSEMNCNEAMTMTCDVFEQYLIITEGYLPEIERFKMITTYATVNGLIDSNSADTLELDEEPEDSDEEVEGLTKKKESETKGKYVKMLLGHIKYNNMHKDDFYNIVGKSPLLTFKEKYEYIY
ncbi:hypothetical protein KR038_002516, partial [Drosophila bunnanda]